MKVLLYVYNALGKLARSKSCIDYHVGYIKTSCVCLQVNSYFKLFGTVCYSLVVLWLHWLSVMSLGWSI